MGFDISFLVGVGGGGGGEGGNKKIISSRLTLLLLTIIPFIIGWLTSRNTLVPALVNKKKWSSIVSSGSVSSGGAIDIKNKKEKEKEKDEKKKKKKTDSTVHLSAVEEEEEEEESVSDDDAAEIGKFNAAFNRALGIDFTTTRRKNDNNNGDEEDDPFKNVSIVLHLNGEVETYWRSSSRRERDSSSHGGSSSHGEGGGNDDTSSLSLITSALKKRAQYLDLRFSPPDLLTKYEFDSFLTEVFVDLIESSSSTSSSSSPSPSLLDFCDMGELHTPKLPDHDDLQVIERDIEDIEDDEDIEDSGTSTREKRTRRRTMTTTYLPCHYHTREGVRISSLLHLSTLAREKKKKKKKEGGGEEEESSSSSLETKKDTCMGDDDNGEGTGGGDGGTCSTKNKNAKQYYIAEIQLYAVQAGRNFIFAPSYIGEVFHLSHVSLPSQKRNLVGDKAEDNTDNDNDNDDNDSGAADDGVSLEVLSLSPRVFEVKNFFSRMEASTIVEKALSEQSNTHKMKRSSTGATGYNVNSKRTSENAFDTHSKMAMIVKRRCFQVLGFDTYIESMADGLQVLRYNVSTAYTDHLDWIDDYHVRQEHNYDSGGIGTNRFATIILYMSDLPENGGGETVFVNAWPNNNNVGHGEEEGDEYDGNHEEYYKALQRIRNDEITSTLFQPNTWEETLLAHCQTRLSIKPKHAKAILFYSQLPNGYPDRMSLHGGCPVIEGTKWAANLWVWNGPRAGYSGAPMNKEVVRRNRKQEEQNQQRGSGSISTNSNTPQVDKYSQLYATFRNTKTNPRYKNAELYFQDSFWGKLGFNDEALNVNTYEGHEWYIKVNGEILKEFVISEEQVQLFEI